MTMPSEFGPHAGTVMGYPRTTYNTAIELEHARNAWGDVALAIAEFEPVTMLADPSDVASAEAAFGSNISVVSCPLDDAWLRDIGPTFSVVDGELVGIDWTFNGWGGQSWAQWSFDKAVAEAVTRLVGARRVTSNLVNEGGGIEVNGAGRAVLTETVQLDPNRNPGWTRSQVEAELSNTLGIDQPIWIPRGLAGDYGPFATRGHVDLVVKFITRDVALVHRQRNPEHPDFSLFGEVAAILEAKGITVVALDGPRRIDVDGSLCDWSYINCYPTNGGLIMGTFDDEADDAATTTLTEAFPDRRVIGVDARVLFSLGGGVHCITQQIPLIEQTP